MKREWSGCERRRRSPVAIAFPTARRCVPRRRVVLLRRAFQHPARSRPSRSDALPAQVLRQTNRARGRVGQDPSNPDTGRRPIVQAKCPCARCRFATALPPARRWARPLSGIYGRCRNGPAPQGPVTDGRTRQGRRVGLRPGQGVRRAPPVPPRIAAFRQAAPAAPPASCAPRPHCERPGRHCAAWRCSPPYCGWSPPCRASSRKQRTAIRSRRGAAR